MQETFTSLKKNMAKEQAKGERKNMLRLSPFEVEYEDIQINNHAIAPTVLKQNVRSKGCQKEIS